MCRLMLFETILIEHGVAQNLPFHQQRVEKAFAEFFPEATAFNLNTHLNIPEKYRQGIIRCRIDYNRNDVQIIYSRYQRANIQEFEFIERSGLDYRFKYSNRDIFADLTPNQIIVNDGFISDTPIANLLFYRQGRWFSPAHYLLQGTQLSALLAAGKVTIAPIRPSELTQYEKMMWINAMNPFDEQRAMPLPRSLRQTIR